MFQVYIIYSSHSDVFYKGVSADVKKRLNDHNTGKSTYTKGKGPWKLVYLESFESKSEALKREKSLKRQNRQYIKWLLEQPTNNLL